MNKILINSLILSIGILIGRFSGYIRELVIAYKFEVSSQADNIILMLTIPDLLNNLLAAGAISGILIPLLSNTDNVEDILTEFTKKLFIITIVFYFIILIIIFFMYENYIFILLLISLLSIFPNIFTFISSSYLQYEERFKAQSLNTLIFNIVIISALLMSFYEYLFAVSVIIASIVRMIWIINDLKFTNISISSFFKKNIESKLNYKILFFMIFANGLIFINPMIDKMFAAFLVEGSVSILSYSEKIYLLPVSVFLTTYAVAMFPNLSKLIANNEIKNVNSMLKKSIIFNIFISFVVGCIIYIFSLDIVNIFYSVANIKDTNIILISNVLDGYLLSLVFAGANSILLNLFFAHKWYNKLIYYSIFMLLMKISLNSIVVYFNYDVFYIALSTSILVFLSVIILILTYIFSKKEIAS